MKKSKALLSLILSSIICVGCTQQTTTAFVPTTSRSIEFTGTTYKVECSDPFVKFRVEEFIDPETNKVYGLVCGYGCCGGVIDISAESNANTNCASRFYINDNIEAIVENRKGYNECFILSDRVTEKNYFILNGDGIGSASGIFELE